MVKIKMHPLIIISIVIFIVIFIYALIPDVSINREIANREVSFLDTKTGNKFNIRVNKEEENGNTVKDFDYLDHFILEPNGKIIVYKSDSFYYNYKDKGIYVDGVRFNGDYELVFQ